MRNLRPAHSRILAQSKADTLTVRITGNLDLSLSFDLWHICRLEQNRYRHYIFDLEKIVVLHDSGLAWLRMFQRHALRAGAQILIAKCRNAIARRCAAVGLEVIAAKPWIRQFRQGIVYRAPVWGPAIALGGGSRVPYLSLHQVSK